VRRLTSILLSTALVPAAIALPTVTRPVPPVHPVPPRLHTVALPGVDAVAAADLPAPGATGGLPAGSALRALSRQQQTAGFSTVGVTWATDRGLAPVSASVRIHAKGRWSRWTDLGGADDVAPDNGSIDVTGHVVRTGTSPMWVGPADGVQARVATTGRGRTPRDLRVDLIDPGTSGADKSFGTPAAPPSSASAAPAMPTILRRAQWGADESIRKDGPSYSATVKIGFVHHTDTSNVYTSGQSASIVRSIYAYHVLSNGWSDIGYNFLVDRYGQIFEGRYGGVDQAVIGAHTGGFNTNSFAASLIGDFTASTPPAAMTTSLERLFAWKLSLYYRNPNSTDTLVSAGGGTDRWPVGATVRFNVIAGHRDAGYTTCPGDVAYAMLPSIRAGVTRYLGPGLVSPAPSTGFPAYAGSALHVTAGVLQPQTWTLSILRDCGGALVRRYAGSASTGIDAVWDLKDAIGRWVRPGAYRLVLTSNAGAVAARPWSGLATVTMVGGSTSPPTGIAAPVGPTGYVAVTPTRLLDTRSGFGAPSALPLGAAGRVDVQIAGRAGVPTSGVAAVVLNLTAVCASTATYLSAYPAGTAWPRTSSVNLDRSGIVAALVAPKLGVGGKVSIYNGNGSTDAVVDVIGYYPVAPAIGSLYHPVVPVRELDTRSTGGPLGARATRTLHLRTPPAGATAAVVNVTAVAPTSAGFMTVYAAGRPLPGTSSLNFAGGRTTANRVVTALSSTGDLTVYNSAGSTGVVLDVVGWYASPVVPGGRRYVPVAPTRILDTRTGAGGVSGPVGARATVTFRVWGGSVPETATAAIVTLTATSATAGSYVTAWPSGVARPPTSDLNLWPGATVANLAVVPIGADGRVALYNAAGTTHLIADVQGYYS